MLRVALPIALVVLGGIIWLSVFFGIQIGKARQATAQGTVNPELFDELTGFARSVIAPPQSMDLDDVLLIPTSLRARGESLVRQASRAQRAGR